MPVLTEPPENYIRTCVKWDDGWLEFDCVLRQSIENDGEVTEHPVDSGADIVDHYRRLNTPLILEAEVTNSPLRLPNTHTDGSQQIVRTDVVEIAAPVFPGAPTNLFGVDITTKNTVQISTVDYSPGLDRVNAVYEELELMQSEPRIVTVSLGRFRDFPNMLLKRFTIDRDNQSSNSMPLTLEFRQVTFAEVVDGVAIEVPEKPRSNKKKDAGKQNAQEVGADSQESQSLLSRLAS